MRCLGIDFGSSNIKGAVLNLKSGRVEHVEREPFPDALSGTPAGFHEVDPQCILTASIRVIEKLATVAPDAEHLFCCGQMGGVILVDSECRPLTNYLSWRDQRSLVSNASSKQSTLQEVEDRLAGRIFAELGRELKPGTATVLLYWLARQGLLPRDASPVSVGDYVIGRLSGNGPKMHKSHMIGMLNLTSGDWHREAFEILGLNQLRWPDFAVDTNTAGQVTIEGRKLSVSAVLGDQQAALRGIQLQPDELSINISTGSQVSQITPSFVPGECQTRCWFGDEFLNTVTHIPAGRSLTVLESLLSELGRAAGCSMDNSWKLIADATERADGGGLKCDLGFFASAMGQEGRIEGITTENLTVGNLFQAAFEFMADSYVNCAGRLSRNPSWSRIAVSGGLIQAFPSLRRKLESRFSWPIREVAEQEETMMGLLLWANEIVCPN